MLLIGYSEMKLLSWGKFFRPSDSLGRESRTLFFISVGCAFMLICQLAVLLKFMWLCPTISVTEFSAAQITLGGFYITLLGVWLGREWLKKGSEVVKNG